MFLRRIGAEFSRLSEGFQKFLNDSIVLLPVALLVLSSNAAPVHPVDHSNLNGPLQSTLVEIWQLVGELH